MAARLLGLPQAHGDESVAVQGRTMEVASDNAMAALEARADPSLAASSAVPSAPSSVAAVADVAGSAASGQPLNEFAGLRRPEPLAQHSTPSLPHSPSGFERSASQPASAAFHQSGAAPRPKPLDLDGFGSVDELRGVGPETLKAELLRRAMKCGGTLDERAERLWKARGIPLFKLRQELEPSLFAKKGGADGKRSVPVEGGGGFVRQQGPLLPGETLKRGQKRIRSSRAVAVSQQHGSRGGNRNEFGMPSDSILLPENRDPIG